MHTTPKLPSMLFIFGLLALACCGPTQAQPTVVLPTATILQPTQPVSPTSTTLPTPANTPAQPELPTPAPSPAQVNAEVLVSLSSEQIRAGETITATVTVQINNSQQCQYPLYEVSLVPVPNDSTLLRFDTPNKIGPPGPNPATFRLTAISSGTIQLSGIAYGEQNCGSGWQWTYKYGASPTLTILPATSYYLPYVVAI